MGTGVLSLLVFYQLLLREEEGDLDAPVLRGIRAMHNVLLLARGKIFAHCARSSFFRVRRADQFPEIGYGVLLLQRDGNTLARAHERRQIGIKRTLAVDSIKSSS